MVDERALVDRARTDPDAFVLLYRHYLPRIHAFATRRCGSRDLADDITAVTFERALRGLPTFAWDRGGFSAWLHRIAANELVDHHRAARRARGDRAQLALGRLVPGAEPGPDHRDDHDALRTALASLTPRYQRVLMLRYLADLDPAEAAASCDLSPAHFAVVLHRARAALRKRLTEVADDAGPR